MERFEELKQELLKRAKDAGACKDQYARAYSAQTLKQLMEVCRDNFLWACNNKVLDIDIIAQYHDEFACGEIYANEDVTQGYLLCSNASVNAYSNASVNAYNNASVIAFDNASVYAFDNASVNAYNNASVIAFDNADVNAYNNASVIAFDNADVNAYDNARVEAWDHAYITSLSVLEVKLSNYAIYRIRENDTIRYANPKIKFELIE
ncbi:MAG: hypothetical protein IJ557_02610 [Bacteroidaceae bacterium]|nr:hypothetical protein [Bacteroidaceae bacterium]